MKSNDKLLAGVIKGNQRVPILMNVCVRKGVAIATDLEEVWVAVENVTANDGVYDGAAWSTGRHVPTADPVDDFLAFPDVGQRIATITSEGISDVIMCLPNNCKFNLDGALFVINGKRKAIMATDGHRMHIHGDALLEGKEFIISKNVCSLLMERDSWVIHEGKKNDFLFFVSNDGLTIACKKIDQKFPNYKAIIPDQMHPEIGNEDMIDCMAHFHRELKRMKVSSRNNAVFVKQKDGKLYVYREHDEKGFFFSYGPDMADSDNNEFYAAYNGGYIADINKIPGKKTVHYKDSKSPLVIKTEKGMCMIMPLNL